MTIDELKLNARTGDVLIVSGSGVVSTMIRCLTGESYSHVAVLAWVLRGAGRELMVYEFVEGEGFRISTLSSWLADRTGQELSFGVAPEPVHQNSQAVRMAAERYGTEDRLHRSYGYISLGKVWLSQLLRLRLPVIQKVCSTYAQELWRAGRFDDINRTADPGDIARHCKSLYPLEVA